MTRVQQPHPLPAWRRLHVRAALLAAPLLMLLGAGMYLLLQHYSAQTALEAGQRMNLGLAQYVVDHQEPGLLDAQGKPNSARVQELAMHVMKINPAVEVYFLDRQGRVLAHALEGLQGPDPVGSQVEMEPFRQLLEPAKGTTPRFPLLGTDPIQPNRPTTFSVAPLMSSAGVVDSYLYIVLNGRLVQSEAASLGNSRTLQAMALAAAVASLLAAAVLWLVWHQLTRPLRELSSELSAFRGEGTTAQAIRRDEIDVLRGSVRDLQNRIARQFQALDDSDRQRRELVSNISHDLRTPLSNIRGYIETVMLRGDSIDAEARANHLRTALRHVDLLGKRVRDLFELSKLDAGRATPQTEVFCLAELLQDVVQNYQLTAQQRGIALHLSTGSQAKARVVADIAMIERVLQNLIDNALRHTGVGGTVELAIENHGAFMNISVSDTGQGIRSEHLPHIFERYWRAPEVDDHGAGTSSGLGLAIVKRILELHGSAVKVQSEFKRGTRFGFELPQAT
ncbi:MAG: sensor histidine kinase [Hydrogenophaga sp.]